MHFKPRSQSSATKVYFVLLIILHEPATSHALRHFKAVEVPPVGDVEGRKEGGDEGAAHVVHGVGDAGLLTPVEADDHDEVDDDEEDEDDAHEHPDVEQGDVGDARHVRADRGEHGREGEQGGHRHRHPAWGR